MHHRRMITMKTKAAFADARGRWTRHTWTHTEPNKHAAIVAKAMALGAAAWDYGNADHMPADEWRVSL